MLEVTLCSIKVDVLDVYWFFQCSGHLQFGVGGSDCGVFCGDDHVHFGCSVCEDACVVSMVMIFVVAK